MVAKARVLAAQVIDNYFVQEECPYTKRRKFSMKVILWTLGIAFAVFVTATLLVARLIEKNQTKANLPDLKTSSPSAYSGSAGLSMTSGLQSAGIADPFLRRSLSRTQFAPTRSRSANQVIRPGANSGDSGDFLPMGYGISAKLLNSIRSGDNATPVIAEVIEDVFNQDAVVIPRGTKAIGQASYDVSSNRAQLRFHTFVYPEGEEHPMQAIALMADGSAGLEGDYHSGAGTRQAGRFMGNFVGGLAEGMKERTGVQGGIVYEPGSIRNGVLNGIALSVEDQTKTLSDDLSATKPFMMLSIGQSFVLFLEKQYKP